MELNPEEHWYEDGIFIRAPSPAWVKKERGFNDDSMGDLGSENARWAMIENNYERLFACMDLLLKGERWPNRMNEGFEEHISKNRLDCWWAKFLHWWDPWLHPFIKYRWQNGMTRDPFKNFYFAAVVMGKPEMIEDVPPVWYCWRPSLHAWRMFMITKEERWKRRWERRASLSLLFRPPVYALHQTAWQAWIAKSTRIQSIVSKQAPSWNLCIRQLCLVPFWKEDGCLIHNIKPRKGFIWSADKWNPDEKQILPEGLKRYMDRQTLELVFNKNLENQTL